MEIGASSAEVKGFKAHGWGLAVPSAFWVSLLLWQLMAKSLEEK